MDHGGPLWHTGRVLILSLTGEAKLWTLGNWACAPVEFVVAYAALFMSIKEQVERLKCKGSFTIHVLRIHRSRRNKHRLCLELMPSAGYDNCKSSEKRQAHWTPTTQPTSTPVSTCSELPFPCVGAATALGVGNAEPVSVKSGLVRE